MRNIILSCFILASCGSDSSSKKETYSCEVPRKSFSGCCSSHGGFENNCEAGKGELKFNSGGALVCNDGSLSATCAR